MKLVEIRKLSDELPGNALSTQFFFKTCRKVSGLDLSSFQDQWVFGSGCPHFRISTNFIRKKFIVELFILPGSSSDRDARKIRGMTLERPREVPAFVRYRSRI
jgi:hypothetical protein